MVHEYQEIWFKERFSTDEIRIKNFGELLDSKLSGLHT